MYRLGSAFFTSTAEVDGAGGDFFLDSLELPKFLDYFT